MKKCRSGIKRIKIMLIKHGVLFVLALAVIHCADGSGNKEVDMIPLPDGFLHISVPRRLTKDFAAETGMEHSNDFFYNEYDLDIPDGFLFDSLYVTMQRSNLVWVATLGSSNLDQFITADGKTLLPAYEEQLNTVLRILEDFYGESKPEKSAGPEESSDPNTVKGRYFRIVERRIWLLEPDMEFYFGYVPAEELQNLLSESDETDLEWIRLQSIYIFAYTDLTFADKY